MAENVDTASLEGGKWLDRGVGQVLDGRLGLPHGVFYGAEFEFVRLGEQDVQGQFVLPCPVDHHQVELFEYMANVGDQHQSGERFALVQVVLQVLLPVEFYLERHLGVAVSRQIDQVVAIDDAEKIDQLGAARGFTGTGESDLAREGVDGAGFTGVGAAGKRHFAQAVVGTVAQTGGTDGEVGSLIVHGSAFYRSGPNSASKHY